MPRECLVEKVPHHADCGILPSDRTLPHKVSIDISRSCQGIFGGVRSAHGRHGASPIWIPMTHTADPSPGGWANLSPYAFPRMQGWSVILPIDGVQSPKHRQDILIGMRNLLCFPQDKDILAKLCDVALYSISWRIRDQIEGVKRWLGADTQRHCK